MDKELLFKRKAGNDTELVSLGDGIEVMVRGLSHGEVVSARGTARQKRDAQVVERHMIAAALVDPVMTYDEVTLWLCGDPDDPDDPGAPAGDSVTIMAAVAGLSGLDEGARKSSVPAVRKRQRR